MENKQNQDTMQNEVELNNTKKRYFTPTRMAEIAIFSALATILYFIRFPISVLFPSFLELNLSDIPALIGSFSLGPMAGVIIVLIKILIKLPFTSTACVGELADLLIGWSFIIPAGFIYKYHRNFKGALIGLLVGTFASVAVGVLSNWLILIPFFRNVWGMDAIVGVTQVIFPNCTTENFYAYYLPLSVLPFNLLRCFLASLVTLLVYKRISKLIHKFN